MEVATLLDTAVGEEGFTQKIPDIFLKKDKPLRVHCDLGSGDTVLIQGRGSSSHDWDTLHTFTDETPVDIYLSAQIRAVRTVDGTSAESYVYAQNPYDRAVLDLTDHEA